MTTKQFRKMMMEMLKEIDYDISKQYDARTAEEPEYVEGRWHALERIAKKHKFVVAQDEEVGKLKERVQRAEAEAMDYRQIERSRNRKKNPQDGDEGL